MHVKERYAAVILAANTAVILTAISVAGFLCKTSGTINIVDGAGKTIVDTFPVAAGVYYPIPFFLQRAGGVVTTASGASGTLAV